MGLTIHDIKLKQSVDVFFEKLEKFFPEHKIFALDSIDQGLREKLNDLYKKTACGSAEEFLAAYGYEFIYGNEVKKIRDKVIYSPGNEPEFIKKKVESALNRLNEYYPDHKITRGIQNDHKNLACDLSGLYQWLGYETVVDMLKAYGFETLYNSKGGRKVTNDYQKVIDMLKEKYSGENRPKRLQDIKEENPEIAGILKTMANSAKEIFGMTIKDYFIEEGILAPVEKKITPKTPKYNYLIVAVYGYKELKYCAVNTRSIHEDDAVEMCTLSCADMVIGYVMDTCYNVTEEELPMSIDEMYQYVRKISKRELAYIEKSNIKHLYCSVDIERPKNSYEFYGNGGTLYYISPFEDIGVGDIVKVEHSWYGQVKGVVKKVEIFSENDVPYPVKKTKNIISILKSAQKDKDTANELISSLVEKLGVEVFVPEPLNDEIIEKYEQMTYFSSCVFRGFYQEVRKALEIVYPNETDVSRYMKKLNYGIFQFECLSAKVPQIVREIPNLKGVFFAECWKDGLVYLAYSESGYSTITDLRLIGKCDFYARDRWPLMHDPAEYSFETYDIKYHFDEKQKWENCDYVVSDNGKKLKGGIVIPSSLYTKKSVEAPCSIIKIIYPREEIFDEPTAESSNLSEDEKLENVYVKVKFSNGRTYTYYSANAVKIGSKVYVEGKMDGEIGEVVEFTDMPTGRGVAYVLNVKLVVG